MNDMDTSQISASSYGADMPRECTTVKLSSCGEAIGELQAYDSHGNGRRNKSWIGHVYGIEIELHNLKEVSAFARAKGYDMQKI